MPLGRLCVDYLSGARHSYGVKIHLSPSYGDDQHPAPHDRRRDIAYGGSLAYRCDGLAPLADVRLAHLLDRTVPLPVVHAVVYRRARPPKPPRLGRWQQVLADALDQNLAIGVRAAVARGRRRRCPQLSGAG
jgi:hypothetical protein